MAIEGKSEEKLVQHIMLMFKNLKAKKEPYNITWQDIGEYVRIRRQNFTSTNTDGEILTERLFDTTAVFALRAMAAALLGALLPSIERSIKITAPDSMKNQTEVVKKYFEQVTAKLAELMGARETGLSSALDEYMLDAGSFGWGGVTLIDDKEDFEFPVKFTNWDPKHTYIGEDTTGFINTVFYNKMMKVLDVKETYGEEALSDRGKKALEEGRIDAEEEILIAIYPRLNTEAGKSGAKDKKIASIHINVGTKQLLKESGFDYMPPTIGRFSKNAGEVYGRGPAIDAYPDIIMANAQAESIIKAAEKQLEPPLIIMDDGTLGMETIDTSAGGVNVASFQGKLPTSSPVLPLFTVGESRSMKESLDETRKTISQHFLIDRLLDFNNEVRMTLGETQIRERIRGESLSSVFNRQISEMFNPLIKKTFNVLFERGYLGVEAADSDKAKELSAEGVEIIIIPQEVVNLMNNNSDVYKVVYISPAARIMNKEQVTSALTTLDTMINAAQIKQQIGDWLDEEKFLKLVNDGTGGDPAILKAKEKVEKLRAAQAEQAQENTKVDNAQKGAMTVRDLATAKQMGKE